MQKEQDVITLFQKRAVFPLPVLFLKSYLGSNFNLPLTADGGEVGGGALFDCSLIKWKLNTFLLGLLTQRPSKRAHAKAPILSPAHSLLVPK